MRRLNAELIKAYARMYALTAPRCGCTETCRVLTDRRCCNPEHCSIAEEWSRDFGWGGTEKYVVDGHNRVAPNVKFLAKGRGCTLPPHMRPLCTVHDCEVYVFGGMKDERKNVQYFALRDHCSSLEYAKGEADAAYKEACAIARVARYTTPAYAGKYLSILRYFDTLSRPRGVPLVVPGYVQAELGTHERKHARPTAVGVYVDRKGP